MFRGSSRTIAFKRGISPSPAKIGLVIRHLSETVQDRRQVTSIRI